MSQSLEWSQDNRSINVRIYVGATSLRKIDVFLSDLVVKVNIKESKFLKTLDLHAEIDYDNNENLTMYDRGTLELYLIKKEPGVWPDLHFKSSSKEELVRRRDASLRRKENKDKEFENQKSDLKIKFDKHATHESMRIDQLERTVIENKKQDERKKAEDDLYGSLDEQARFTKANEKAPKRDKSDTDIFNADEVPVADEKELQSRKQAADRERQESEAKPENIINEPRKATSVQMKFTEKTFPHLAARESHLKEPPMPKDSQYPTGQGAADEKNPHMLKDKGDKFFSNGDYNSAINAYTAAFRIRDDLIECVSNRSVCLMKQFLLEEALKDVNYVIDFIEKTKKSSLFLSKPNINRLLAEDYFLKLRLKMLLRKGIIYAMKGLLDQGVEILNSVLEQKDKLLESDVKQIEDQIAKINKRKEANVQKKQADLLVKKSKVDEAIQSYEEIMRGGEQNHEWILSNLALAHLKKENYDQVLVYTEQILSLTGNVAPASTLLQSTGRGAAELRELLQKTHFRKAKAYAGLQEIEKALSAVKDALSLNERNAEVKKLQTQLQATVTVKEVETTKQEAAALIKEKKFREALEKYNECLKKIPHTDIVTYLSILLNKCTCHLFLEEFEDISSLCIRGLNLISNFRNRIIGFGDASLSKDTKEKLVDFEVRFLVRRGNAYGKLKRYYHAKSDFEEALKLDPKNEQIKKDLENINSALT